VKLNKKQKQALKKGLEATIDRSLNSCIDPHKICSVEPLDIESVLSQYTKNDKQIMIKTENVNKE
jgi:hypothetical protein